MAKKYTTDEIEIGSHSLDATMMVDLNNAISWGDHSLAGYIVLGSTIPQSPSWTGATKFKSAGDVSEAAGNHSLQIISDLNNDAFMAFHISGDYAVHFGLDNSTNRLHVGGWSEGTGTKHLLWDSRDFSSTNISNWNTAYGWGNHASAGYITGYAETDTLQTVTSRGATTNIRPSFDNGITVNGLSYVTNNGYFVSAAQGFRWNDSSGNYNNVIMRDNGTSWFRNYIETPDSVRAPIFYDVSNTAYYIDPATTGTSINVRGTIQNPSIWINDGDEVNNYNENIRLFNASNGVSVIAFGATGVGGTPQSSTLGFADRQEVRIGTTWRTRTYGGYFQVNGDARATLFYDSNNTAYYVDPASTSNLNTLNAATINRNPVVTLSGDVTGAATMTNLGSININTSVGDDSHNHSQVFIPDTRGSSRNPNYYPDRYVSFDFQNTADTGAGGDSWHVLQTIAPWSNYNNTHRQQQLVFTGTGGVKFRYATSETAWAGWRTMWDSSNLTNLNQLTNGPGYVTSSGNTVIGTDADINTSGATIIDNLYMTDGVITSHGTRNLTIADIGAAPASHNHDDRYFTESESNNRFAYKAGSSGQDFYVDDLYYDQWIRNNNSSNSGFYWESGNPGYGWHVYPQTRQDITFRTGLSNGGIKGTIENETARGYIHWTTSNEIGFLNNSRSWSLRVDSGGNTFATASSRAPIFYDSNNTSYYLNPADTSNLNNLSLVGAVVDDLAVNGDVLSLGMVRATGWWNYNSSDTSGHGLEIGVSAPGSTEGYILSYNRNTSTYGNINFAAVNFNFDERGGTTTIENNEIWHAGNDGSGSGLDADLLDGIDSSRIVYGSGSRKTNNQDPNTAFNSGFYDIYQTNAPTNTWYSYLTMAHTNEGNKHGHQIAGSFYSDGDLFNRHYDGNGSFGNWTRIWNAANDGSGSGLDADLLDGVQGASFLRSDTTDSFSGNITFSSYLISNARDKGLFGVYDSTKTDQIWSMGTAYRNHSAGTNFGNLYGLAYKHTNNTTGGTMGGGHQMVWCTNGNARGSIGYNAVWHAESMKAPIYYDSGNTAYYGDFASNSRYNTAQGNYLGLGNAANTSGSYRLNMGGNIRMNNNGIDYTSQLHFNSNVRFYQDSNDSYLNFKYGDATTGGIKFLNGGGSLKGYVYADNSGFGLLDNDGAWAIRTQTGTDPLEFRCDNNPEFYVYTSYTYSPGSSRAPIFYDSNNTSYYLDPASTGTSAKFAGSVGIGTTSPGSKLEVVGNTSSALLTLKSSDGGANDSFMRFYNEDAGSSYSVGLDSSDAKFKIAYDTDGDSLTTGTKLVIDTSGNVGIGTTSPGQKLDVAGNIECSSLYLNNASSLYFLPTYFGQRIKANCQGLLVQNGSTYQAVYASAFSVQSDYRLKSNVVPLDNAIDRLKQMSVHRFNWNDRLDEPKVDGFIAHELSEVIPEAVLGEKDATKEDGTPDYQGIDQSKIVPLLTAALQDAITKIEQLETRIQTLENNN